MKIANLTQHAATPEQASAGVFDLPAEAGVQVRKHLNFEEVPEGGDILAAAAAIAEAAVASGAAAAMIGGAPFLMGPLTRALQERGLDVLFAFSRRESVEETLPSGEVRKTSVFRHAGFVRAT